MRKRVVIVGAGLGGCFLADQLAESYDVTVIELGESFPLLQDRVKDVARAAVTYPHVCSGLGGTTRLWHNGLIEIDERIFEERWPYAKTELKAYYERAFLSLSGLPHTTITDKVESLLKKYRDIGFSPKLFGEYLYYPKKRVNPWKSLKLASRVRLIDGEVTDFKRAAGRDVCAAVVRMSAGTETILVDGDIFVLSAGGLSTPLLLERLKDRSNEGMLDNVGYHYEDHPCALVGEMVLSTPLYKLWNYPCHGGNLRLPMMIWKNNTQISFQLKPTSHFLNRKGRDYIKSVLSELRNNLFSLKLYWRLFANFDDILEVISFKIGVNFPTRYYHLLMVAEQSPAEHRAVFSTDKNITISREWLIEDSQIATYEAALEELNRQLGDKVYSVRLFSDWQANIFSSSHHSGTARMANTEKDGVCDHNARVFGFDNLFVADGSLIPATGIANTGLTIAALAMKLGDHIHAKFS